MSGIEIEYLLGLFFIGTSLPAMFSNPIARATLVTFVIGLVLTILAVLKISFI